MDRARLQAALRKAADTLLARANSAGYWEGHLSHSALSTATAVTALTVLQRACPQPRLPDAIQSGLQWLATHANDDGGWGDTVLSKSNLSTTTLAWAALGAVPQAEATHAHTVARAQQWLTRHIGGTDPDQLAPAVISRYGKDRTFSVPILTHCAIAGRLGTGPAAWRHVIPLPFELAAFPRSWFATLRLPVVSYALPALIAIGQARFHHAPPRNPVSRLLRQVTRQPSLKVLEAVQPPHGGFLEATPLTSFVTMSLGSIGLAHHPVAQRGREFLLQSQRPDGSWPIDTNLATWLTTLSVQALGPHLTRPPHHQTRSLLHWLLHQQYREPHPYTNAAPGGWAWTNLPGGVPDADDTAGALLALHTLAANQPETLPAAEAGLIWLCHLQNRDGGIPTFCRGWGTLPFDRSSADISAHALRAWLAWLPQVTPPLQPPLHRSIHQAARFLIRQQRKDGAWIPLWFGNQHDPQEENPTYGTSRVLIALAKLLAASHPAATHGIQTATRSGLHWLIQTQNPDGSWGGGPGLPPSIEETALALDALAITARLSPSLLPPQTASSLHAGASWLVNQVESGAWTQPAPIGFYFARLWYYETLYPLVFTTGALRQLANCPLLNGT